MVAARKTANDPRGSAPPAKKADKPQAAAAAPGPEVIKRRQTTADKEAGREMVSVTVPRPFKFNEANVLIDYPVGVYDMPRAHALDSFTVAMGVTVNDEK